MVLDSLTLPSAAPSSEPRIYHVYHGRGEMGTHKKMHSDASGRSGTEQKEMKV